MIPGAGYKVRVTVVGVTNGQCPVGHKAGDTWLIDEMTPANLCVNAFGQEIYTKVRTFRFGGEHPWDKEKDVTYALCPDAKHQVKFEIRRLRE